MSMHLEGPWLSTTGKRKGKTKFRNAEAARQARELDNDWIALQKRWGVEQDERKRKNGLDRPAYVAPKPQFRGSEWLNKPSLNSGTGIAAKKDSPVYTGDLIAGVATMHKSNAVPVLRGTTEAEDIAKMRR